MIQVPNRVLAAQASFCRTKHAKITAGTAKFIPISVMTVILSMGTAAHIFAKLRCRFDVRAEIPRSLLSACIFPKISKLIWSIPRKPIFRTRQSLPSTFRLKSLKYLVWICRSTSLLTATAVTILLAIGPTMMVKPRLTWTMGLISKGLMWNSSLDLITKLLARVPSTIISL